MFQPLKNLFSKLGRKQPEAAPAPAPAAPAKAAPSKPAPPAKDSKPAPPPPAAKNAPAKSSPPPVAAASAAPAPAAAPPVPSGPPEETFALPLRVVLSRLPASLAASVKSTGGGELHLPLKKVLAQLPTGSVKISFGELRQASPPGTFLEVASQDSTLIELPLPEIVSRINPNLISRRQDQKTIEVPAEVGNVFGPHGETIAPPPPPSATAVAPAPAAPKPAAPAPAPIAAPKPILPTPPAIQTPAPTPAAAPAPTLSSPALPKPPAPAAPLSSPGLPKPPTPAPAAAAQAAPAPIAAPKLPTPPSAPMGAPKMPTAPNLPKPPTPAAPAAPAPAPAGVQPVTASGTLAVTLLEICANWPEAVKQEIASQNLKNSLVALPMASIETGLKTGKIVFTWREVGGWLNPKAFTTSSVGDTLLELPLKIIAPKFIEQHKPAKPQKKLSLGENIPDIFSGGVAPGLKPAAPAPAAAAPAPAPVAPAPAPAPAPVAAPSLPKMPTAPAPAQAPAAAPAAKVPATLGEVFGDASKTEWGPKEIVSKLGAVKGLAGGVISTHDGLMVAGELPAPLKADMVAAFLPQIFSRMNQYGKELQAGGDVNSMSVTFDKVPWQISKLGKIYFAAVGRPGEPLPAAQLAVICGELAKQNK